MIENEFKEHESCGRPPNLEEKLMMVYGRLEALASCARQKLCSFSRIVDMIEAIDHMTVLSFSNYRATRGEASASPPTPGVWAPAVVLMTPPSAETAPPPRGSRGIDVRMLSGQNDG